MRAGKHGNPGDSVAEDAFEFAHEVGFEDVFDHVGIAVNMAGGDVGVGDEVGFPEAVVAGDAGGFAETGFAENDGVVGVAGEVF